MSGEDWAFFCWCRFVWPEWCEEPGPELNCALLQVWAHTAR